MHSPRVQCAASPPRSQPQFPDPPLGCALCPFWEADFWLRPSQRMSTIQSLRKSLVRSWEAVCSVVGGAVSEAEFASFPSPLPPASGGGWAGPQQLALLWNCSVLRSGNGWVVPKFRAFPRLILSLSCYPTV